MAITLMICRFTSQVGTYRGDPRKLADHVQRCPSCRVAADLIAAYEALPDRKTPGCPDPLTLVDYIQGGLPGAEHQRVLLHASGCGFCARSLRLAQQGSFGVSPRDVDQELDKANRELTAYLLAKDLAEWLSTERYPREQAAVHAAFEITYQRTMSGETAKQNQQRRSTVGAFGFGRSRNATVAQGIMRLACIIGRMVRDDVAATGETIASAIEQSQAELGHCGIVPALVADAAAFLRSRKNEDA